MDHTVENLNFYRKAMYAFWQLAVFRGDPRAGMTPEEFFGFRVIDIACMHRYLAGEGYGAWFRLDDGRVVNSRGNAAITDPSCYDTTIH